MLVGGVLSWLGSLKPSKSVLVGRRPVRSRGAGGRGLMTVWEHEGFFEECGKPQERLHLSGGMVTLMIG